MTAKEYLSQAHLLDQRIEVEVRQAEALHRLAYGLGSPALDERVQAGQRNEAPFERSLDKVMDMETEINRKIDLLVALKAQIQTVIDTVEDYDERMILQYRYLDEFTWSQIGQVQNADRTTLYRRHNRALKHIILPENLIII